MKQKIKQIAYYIILVLCVFTPFATLYIYSQNPYLYIILSTKENCDLKVPPPYRLEKIKNGNYCILTGEGEYIKGLGTSNLEIKMRYADIYPSAEFKDSCQAKGYFSLFVDKTFYYSPKR